MNWEAIGAIGEAISAVTLLLVLVQLRYARAEMRRSVSAGRSGAVRDFLLSLAIDSQQMALSARVDAAFGTPPNAYESALIERVGLTPQEARSSLYIRTAFFQVLAEQIRFIDALPAAERESNDRNIRAAYDPLLNPAGSLWYESTKSWLDQSVVRHIDNLLAQPG